MKVIIFGATGYVGFPIGEALLAVDSILDTYITPSKCLCTQWACRRGRYS